MNPSILYRGYTFANVLSARWAVFFDAIGMEWEYKLAGVDLGGPKLHFPEFRLVAWDTYLEIRPKFPNAELIQSGNDFAFPFPGSIASFLAVHQKVMTKEDATKGMPPLFHNRAFMLCGTPGPPRIVKEKGLWTLKSGSAALNFVPVPDHPLFQINAWCDNGSHDLDLNLYYSPPALKAGSANALIWPRGSMTTAYIGPGRSCCTPRLQKAFAAARDARFEHGENP